MSDMEEFAAQRGGEFTGLYPMATCFYSAYAVAGDEAFPTPADLVGDDATRYAEAAERVCAALREGRPVNAHDKGDDAVILLMGKQPDSHDFQRALEAAGIRSQLDALYEECPTATALVR